MAGDDDYGQMDMEFVQDRLVDFGCTVADDEEILRKLNALSKIHSIKNGDLLDGLIAFIKNCKKNHVSAFLLEEYENQELSKIHNNMPAKKINVNGQRDREVLKDISLDFIGLGPIEDAANFETLGESYELSESRPRDAILTFDRKIKSRFTGSSFVSTDTAQHNLRIRLPKTTILSDCNPESYTYGHSSISRDISEILPAIETPCFNEDTRSFEDEDASSAIFTFSIFPADGDYLTFENGTLFAPTKTLIADFEKIAKISLYPGMLLTLKSLSTGGVCHIQEVIEPQPLEMTQLDLMAKFSRLRVVVGCGPFFITNDKSRFFELTKSLDAMEPNALILVGPFVQNNIDIVSRSPTELFKDFLLNLCSSVNNVNLRIFLVPSAHNDLISMPFFPTPPLQIQEILKGFPENLTCLPDPAIFEVEGVRFAVSASEIVMHLCRKEIYKSPDMENEDRIKRLIAHLFRARSLYPLHPSDPDIAFSLANSREKLQLSQKPHVLILPSMLQPTVKVVDDTLFINPGRFIRGKGAAGTFALLDIDLHSALVSALPGTGTPISQFSEVSLLTS